MHRYPGQAALFSAIMSQLHPKPAALYGWAEPEPLYAKRVSDGGNVVMCAAAPNLSFWRRLQAAAAFRLPERLTSLQLDRSKHYVAFQTNEGDTPKVRCSPRRDSMNTHQLTIGVLCCVFD